MRDQISPSARVTNSAEKPRWRLLLVSSRARHVTPMANCILPGVLMVTYKYETSTLDHILAQTGSALQGKKVEMIALVLHGTETELQICGPGEKVISTHSASEQISVREFCKTLVVNHLDKTLMNARFDFLAAHPANGQDGPIICSALQTLLEIPVAMSVDLFGTDVNVTRWLSERTTKVHSGDLYFDTKKLKESLRNVVQTTKIKTKDLQNYEKIRTVGKGAFGTAVLYRQKDDDILVVIKEINLLELPGTERQMSINEINVLAMMNHPNIVSYLDSFERDSYLCIEMEYADGGSLAQFLQQKTQRMDEKEILMIFHQICSAIRFMHDQNILHRDLKTANIFLTKQGVVKVGDFGISKMLSTQHAQANTVLGTPYYISPEKWEGKSYDEKSDIWALGCILYEMACLQKTFEGSNLPALVNKIMKGQFAPIKGNYSPGFRQLVRDLLQKDPEFRPTAAEILHDRLPELLAQFDYMPLGVDAIDDEMKISIEAARQNGRNTKSPRSVIYHLKVYESSIDLTPVPLPPRIRVKEMAVSNTHVIVLTSECLVYTWGEGRKGQLGNESLENWRSRPAVVESLKEKGITRVCAGDSFSVFASDNGIVMTCGEGTFGCLGHSDWNSNSKPKLIERLLSVDVSGIACGSHHVVVVGGDGEVYSWGKGEGGRLGLGHEEDRCIPTEIESPIDDAVIANVRCGGDGTILLTDQGAMLACGRNARNKLGLDDTSGLFSSKKEVDKALVPTPIKSIGWRVVDVAMGPSHTAVLTETGQVLTFGRNNEAQLGKGNCRNASQPVLVRSMSKKVVTMLQCGSTFSVVGTSENVLYLWGTRAVSPITRPNTQEGFTNTWGQRSALGSAVTNDGKDPDFHFQETSPLSSAKAKTSEANATNGADTTEQADKRHMREINLRDVLHNPLEILALYASPSQVSKGEVVSLSSLHCQNQSIFLVVETTVPLPKPGRLRSLSDDDKVIMASNIQGPKTPENNSIVSDKDIERGNDPNCDTLGPLPEWLKADLSEAIEHQVKHSSAGSNRPAIVDVPHRTSNSRDSMASKEEITSQRRKQGAASRQINRTTKNSPEKPSIPTPFQKQARIGRPPFSKNNSK